MTFPKTARVCARALLAASLLAPGAAAAPARGKSAASVSPIGAAVVPPPPSRMDPTSGRPIVPSDTEDPMDAVLNPGDILQVIVPGEDVFGQPLTVDQSGRILLPEAGYVTVAGFKVGEAREKVRLALSRYFTDLSKMRLVLKERRLLITVRGFVRQPGQVNLPSGANVQQALVAAGGVIPGAQLDHLKLHRDGAETGIDYKRYLDTGNDALLPDLRPLDEIFVPSSPQIGPVATEYDPKSMQAGDAGEERTAVKVFGEVDHPGSYGFRPGMTVMDAIIRSGGPTKYAGVEQVRILSDGEPQFFNMKEYLDSGRKDLNPVLAPGSTVFLPVQSESVHGGKRVVYVMGEVAKPGSFEMHDGIGFMDALANAGGPTRFADTKKVRVIRYDGKVEPFDLAAFTDDGSGHVPKLEGGDAIFVPEKNDADGGQTNSWLKTASKDTVKVIGAVRTPQRLAWDSVETILDLIGQANGPAERADLEHVQILQPDGRQVVFNLKQFLDKGGEASTLPHIQSGATVNVPETPASPNDSRFTWLDLPADHSIYVMGAVGNPGRFAFREGLGLLDILSAANGPGRDADLLNLRITHRNEPQDRVSKVNLARYFETGDETMLPRIKPGDVVFVPSVERNWLEQSAATTIRVLGSVNKPGRYGFNEDMSILDLLAEAGGPSPTAWVTNIIVVNRTPGGNYARSFNLDKFGQTGNYALLPVLRAGDTVYIPDKSRSDWNRIFETLQDVVNGAAVIALFRGL